MDNSDTYYIDEIRNEIRAYMVLKGHSYRTLANLLSKKLGKCITSQMISNKLSRGSLRYIDAKNIAEVLGYKIKWE